MHGIPEDERIKRELAMAGEFQRAVLPTPVPLDWLKTAIVYQPYGEISGDVYHFLLNRERELGVFIGDATGHGVSAALMTMMVMLGLDGIRRNMPTHETLSKLNALLAARHSGLSVTGIFFRICPDGRLSVTHAGHPPLLLIPADGSPIVRFEKGGLPLGMFEVEPIPYEEEFDTLRPGDKLFAYTDAAIEWKNRHGNTFGLDRLIGLLDQHRALDITALNQTCVDELNNYSGGLRHADDLTLLAFEFRGAA